MDVTQLLVALIGGGTVGAIVNVLVQQWNLSRKTRVAERRRETDRANALERDVRRYKEALSVHRRIMIDAPCLGHESLPPWPSTKEDS